jgi:hypothetical protein
MEWSTRTSKSKLNETINRYSKWHTWFAWHPVCVEKNEERISWVWLRKVYRRGAFIGVGLGWNWHYKKDDFDLLKDKSIAAS